MGGSQLKQLKAAISTSGVSQTQSNSRKRKRGWDDGASRGAVLEHRDRRVEKLREIHEKFNSFDTKVEKVKREVGGRKLKGTMGKPGASKQAGIEQVRVHPVWCMLSDYSFVFFSERRLFWSNMN
jgi:nucleolar protein 14